MYRDCFCVNQSSTKVERKRDRTGLVEPGTQRRCVVQSGTDRTERHRGWTGDRRQFWARRNDLHLLVDLTGFRGRVVIAIAAVERLPLVSPRDGSRGWQLITKGCRVTPISTDRDGLRVNQGVPLIQLECDRAGLVVPTGNCRRIHQGRIRRRKGDDRRIGNGRNRRRGRTDDQSFANISSFRNGIVVAVAAVGCIPLVISGHGFARRKQIARRCITTVPMNRDDFGINQLASVIEREGDGTGFVISTR